MYVPNYSYTYFCYLHGIFLEVLLEITRRYANGVPVRARDSLFSTPIQTCPSVHPACCTTGTRELSRVSGSWGVGLSLIPSSVEVLNDESFIPTPARCLPENFTLHPWRIGRFLLPLLDNRGLPVIISEIAPRPRSRDPEYCLRSEERNPARLDS